MKNNECVSLLVLRVDSGVMLCVADRAVSSPMRWVSARRFRA